MPYYLYRCDNEECGYISEEFHGINENHSGELCVICGSGVIRRVLSAVPFKFTMKMPIVDKGENRL